MPFPDSNTRHYTRNDISNFPENTMGCYGIYRKDAWIYIGKGDIRARMLAHLNGDNLCITSQSPTNWIYEITGNMDAREIALITEFDPICNRRTG